MKKFMVVASFNPDTDTSEVFTVVDAESAATKTLTTRGYRCRGGAGVAASPKSTTRRLLDHGHPVGWPWSCAQPREFTGPAGAELPPLFVATTSK